MILTLDHRRSIEHSPRANSGRRQCANLDGYMICVCIDALQHDVEHMTSLPALRSGLSIADLLEARATALQQQASRA